MTELELKLIF